MIGFRRTLLALVACSSLFSGVDAWSQSNTNYTRIEDVIYGRKYGTALTLDVFRPPKPNGFGVIVIVSGGWFSAH